MIKKIKNFNTFYIGNEEFRLNEPIDIEKYIIEQFPTKFTISIESDNILISIDLEGNFDNTYVKSLSWRYFSNKTLIELKNIFGIELRKASNIEFGDNLIAYLNNYSNLNIALKVLENKNYLIIFNIKLPDLYRGAGKFQGSLYIQNICEVELSEGFKRKIFNE
jgi:hypothetical protein